MFKGSSKKRVLKLDETKTEPAHLYGCENWNVQTESERRTGTAEVKFFR
jgi:hypothetical protein